MASEKGETIRKEGAFQDNMSFPMSTSMTDVKSRHVLELSSQGRKMQKYCEPGTN